MLPGDWDGLRIPQAKPQVVEIRDTAELQRIEIELGAENVKRFIEKARK